MASTSTNKTSFSGTPDRTLGVAKVAIESLDLSGRRVVVVGGTDGLGRAIAKQAAARGARVIVVGRTFRDQATAGLEFVKADLSSMREAVRLGRELPADVDAIVLTTGIFAAPQREVTAEGLERDMAISFLSRLAILRELAPRLARAGKRPRVFVMGFPGTGNLGDVEDPNAERSYDAMKVHMSTVAGNEMLVLDGAKRHPGVGFYGLNPGLIKTNIRANYLGEGSLKHRLTETLIGLFMTSPETYAKRIVPLLFAPELEARSGVMFDSKARAILPTVGLTDAYVARFLGASTALVDRALGSSASHATA